MSIYGGKIHLPKISLPGKPDGSAIKSKLPIIIGAIVVIIIVALLLMLGSGLIESLNSSIGVSWKNNPLDLKDDSTHSAELNLVLTNTTDQVTDITLSVTTESDELIVFCPYTAFTKVEPNNNRQVTCIVRRNPQKNIFAGNYTLTIKTNLGETKTTLEVRTK